jgi:hypothetical protein
VVERLDEAEAPLREMPVAIEVNALDGQQVKWQGRLDERGMAPVAIELARPIRGSLRAQVTLQGPEERQLGSGTIELRVVDWLHGAKRRGGWLNGRRTGALRVDVAPGRGVFAVPFSDPLLVRVSDERGAVSGAAIHFELEGAELRAAEPAGLVHANMFGEQTVSIAPREHAVAVRVVVESAQGLRGDWYSSLPIAPGALHAMLEGQKLLVESAIERDVAYYAVISERTRLAGGVIRLEARPGGRFAGLAALPQLPDTPLWAVVSSEPELDSPGAVGWPLLKPEPASDRVETNPLRTFSVPDRLLLNGLLQGFTNDMARKSRARLLAASVCGLSLALIVALLIGRVNRADALIAAHFSETSGDAAFVERVAPRRAVWPIVVAGLCLALGFAAVALVAMYRIR